MITTIKHPTTGDTYAVEMTGGTVVKAAGPMRPTDDPAVWIYASTEEELVDDAEWLEAALAREES